MRLRELDAEFIGEYRDEPGNRGYHRVATIDGAQGVMFQCPVCAVGKERGEANGRGHYKGVHYVICWFRNPRGAAPVPADAQPGPGRWWAEGSSLDDLTFTHGEPSLPKSVQLTGGCNWHGYVENGEARTG